MRPTVLDSRQIRAMIPPLGVHLPPPQAIIKYGALVGQIPRSRHPKDVGHHRPKRTMTPLFDSDSVPPSCERLEEGAVLLHGFATAEAPALIEEAAQVAQAAPFRNGHLNGNAFP